MKQTPVEAPDWTDLKRDALAQALRAHLQGEVRFDPASRALYSTDASIYQIEPIGVVIPKTREDVVAAVSIAMEQRVPLVPRGGGTSLSGQTIGHGLVIDFSKYLNRVLDIDPTERTARVEPGVVLGHLNRALDPHGFMFGPDVATIDRANLGGMIGNNSAGARSVRFGKTIDHVLELDAVLTDGKVARFGAVDEVEIEKLKHRDGRLGQVYRATTWVLSRHEQEIRDIFPKVLRRVSGYSLDALLPPAPLNLAKLLVGSEGTLATLVEARLGIVEKPKHRGIAALHFAKLEDALESTPTILETQPSAIELIDKMIIDLAKKSLEYAKHVDFVDGDPEALLLVEFMDDDPRRIDKGFDELRTRLADHPVGTILASRDVEFANHVWSVRRTGMPLLYSIPGLRKPVTFVEDTAVDPARLASFVTEFKAILARYRTTGSFYGHASVGCLHIRPLLDLHSVEGRRDMAAIADEVVDLVIKYGGSLSGEHGDGLCRSYYNRKLFGDSLYEAFRRIKRGFDPDDLMNPGKIVEAPLPTEHLRTETATTTAPPTLYHFGEATSIADVASRCNGNALCRRQGIGTMCPSFAATHDEQHSPRGRANLLRAAMEGRLGPKSGSTWSSPLLEEALDFCLACKACKTECPTSVDVAKMKSEYLHQSHARKMPPLLARMMAAYPRLSSLGSRFSPFSNWVARSLPTRLFMEWFVGIDRRRKLPRFHRRTLYDWFLRHRSVGRELRGKVVLLADCFINHHEPSVGQAAVELLERAGYQVSLAKVCCGRTMISKGFLNDAKQLARQGIDRLLPSAESGLPILGLEPSCLLTLEDEWRDLVPGDEATLVASRISLVETWLAEQARRGDSSLPTPATESTERLLVHGHCHQKAAGEFDASVRALELLGNAKPTVLNTGCCGMAGAFGYEKRHYDVSHAVAEDRLLPALRAEPEATIVAPGFSCRTQMRDLAGRDSLHPVSYLHRRLLGPE
ncbi:FAD-binding and (Fe-S)-binding domain-containing protein [Kolteria novifilia]|uniref:FAD-binding and (Fe-S)-binding domain-containing protein n=1 Tax=Kolteria novifilia TaxID=2527975 RepID=UPI003AF35BAB